MIGKTLGRYSVEATPVTDRLNHLPVTRAHIRATVIVGLGLFFDLFDVFLAGVLSTVLSASFGLSERVLPAVLGSSFLGMFIGSTFMGGIADRFGRRPAFLVNLGMYSLFTLLGAFSTGAAMLVITRFIAGIGIGAEVPLSDAYLSELLPPAHRGRLMAWAYTAGFIGVPAAGLLARVLVPLRPFDVAGWRWLFVAGSLGGVIVWSLRRLLPESPKWLDSAKEERLPFQALLERPVPQDDAHAFGVPDLSDRRLLRFWHDHPAGAGGEGIFGVIVIDLCDDHVSWLSHRRCPVRRRGRTHGTPATYRCLSAPDGGVWIRSRLCQNARRDRSLWICIHCDQQYLLERFPYPARRGLPHRSSRPSRRSDLWTQPAFKRGHALCPSSGFA